MLAVHFGAGNIGRGFIGSLLHKSGYHVCFVDVNDKLVTEINERKSYEVVFAGETEQKETVDDISALNSQTDPEKVIEAIAKADLVTTAVGPNILKAIAGLIAKALIRRTQSTQAPLNVIACENMINASSLLKEAVYSHLTPNEQALVDESIGFPNAAVDRIVPAQHHDDPIKVSVEPFYEWVIDESQVIGPTPSIRNITFVDDLTPYIERKLYTVNTGHAIAAYLGYQRQKGTIKEALDDPFIYENVCAALHETGSLLIHKYQFDQTKHFAYIDKIIERFENPSISDEVTRVGRSPIRKLGANDRLVGPARELVQLNLDVDHLALGIAAALLYDYEEDEQAVELQKTRQRKGLEQTILNYTGLDKANPLVPLIIEQAERLSYNT